MALQTVHRLACLVAFLVATTSQEKNRWSRQISSYTADISDWVPLPGPVEREVKEKEVLPPIKRQAVAEPRILTEPFPGFARPTGFGQEFPPRNFYNSPANRQLYLQSVPSAPQNYLTDTGFGQSIRFGLSQPNFPLNQGFISPQFAFDGIPPGPPGPPPKPQTRPQPPALQNPIKFDNFAKIPSNQAKPFVNHIGQAPSHIVQPSHIGPASTHIGQPLSHIGQSPSHIGQSPSHIGQSPSHIEQAPSHIRHPQSHIGQAQGHVGQAPSHINHAPKPKPEGSKYVDGYRAENYTNDFTYKKKPVQSLQKIKFENFDKSPKVETIPSKPKVEREEVQLLYVPVESLNRGQFNFRSPMTSPQLVNTDLYSQSLPKPNPLKQPFSSELPKLPVKPIDTFSAGQDYFSSFDPLKDDQIPKYSTVASPFPSLPPTTPKPKKLKPHQPPLAIFLTQEARKGNQIKVGDVLSSLKNAETIAVLDTVNPLNAPKVFIGPSSLKPPENYVRFELPYLSNIENSDKKKLPFFVAPLSYNTPQGFAKIPFPSPHVGSVVINSQIKESNPPTPVRHSSPPANINLNAYTVNQPEQKPVTQKPSFTYYSTASPKTKPTPSNPQPHYYTFEQQAVTANPPPRQTEPNILTAPPKTGSYFLSNVGDQYNPQYINFAPPNQEPVRDYNVNKRVQPESTTTPRTTVTTTTRPSSTYSSQLLETHNPYSINQAFHFSTPLDYHNFYDDFKDPYANHGLNQGQKVSPTPANLPSSLSPQPEEVVTEKTYQQTSPNYLQSYSPEIHYDTEAPNSRYPIYNNEHTTKPEVSSENYQTVSQANLEPAQPDDNQKYNVGSHENVEYIPTYENLTETIINKITGPSYEESPKQVYNQYETSYETESDHETSSTSTTTTTTTRRTPLRTRGRPRYTTTARSVDNTDYTTRAPITRRPLRERRPLPPRSRYEPNKITTEKPTRKPLDSAESTTKSSRTRTRGRVQYKPSENDDNYNKRNKGHGTKEEDLAYQRDVLHQNYPVTLMERMSTVDIEAITEPTQKLSSAGESYDTEQAYAHESASSVSYPESAGSKEDTPVYSSGVEYQTEAAFVSKQPSTLSEEYYYQPKSSAAPVQSIFEDSLEKQEERPRQTTSGQREAVSFVTEAIPTAEQGQFNSGSNEYTSTKQEETQTPQEIEITKVSQEQSHETETEENIVQTTPSYNRVRVRPGVIRQYHQASSTERSRPERRKPNTQAITYRPAFDRRRTTMRIEEIEADLKTKQVHSRPEVQDYKHPVYKPEPTTEPPVTTASSADSNKKNHFRRRRPVYTTTTTESSPRKTNYEVKNRFRGRRPTEKPTEKPEVQTDAPSSTVRNTPHRYSHRPRLSERYNRKPEADAEENEDQDSNYSINRPKYAAPEYDQWSPKISADSFKPYNPNDIVEEGKSAIIEQKDEIEKDEGDLDIITARNDYDDILISVTPATNNLNNRGNKKLSDIPPTLEAFVDQSKTTKSDSTDTMSTFETMLEEVMKSLEEQDENEYTSKVMKHKGGEIGEIPPERIISSGEEVTQKPTAVDQEVSTTADIKEEDSAIPIKDQKAGKGHRRGYWKKVKVRPIVETIDTAESQYYTSTVNKLGEAISPSKLGHEKSTKNEKPRVSVTTYKPSFNFMKDFFDGDEEFSEDILPTIDIPKLDKQAVPDNEAVETENIRESETRTEKATSPGDFDLGTGSPDPTLMDSMYYSTPTEPTSSESVLSLLDRSDGFSFMDYLFGTTEEGKHVEKKNETRATTKSDIEISTEQVKPKITTTESTYIPDEITAATEENTESVTEFADIKKTFAEEASPVDTNTAANVETASESSFMNPANVVSTSMSTEVSHETEICFRGKCIKTNKDLL